LNCLLELPPALAGGFGGFGGLSKASLFLGL